MVALGNAPAVALLGLAALGAGAQEPARPADADAASPAPLAPPPARAPIAGLHGFSARSTIAYAAAPDRKHELQAVYAFPERVRWWFALRDARTEERRLRYRYGAHVLAIEPRQARSVEYGAEDRTAMLQAFELRRALFLWPDGFAWTGAGDERSAPLGELGRVRARMGAGEPRRPIEIAVVGPAGDALVSCRAIAWNVPESGRAWPSAFEVWNGETISWLETVEGIDTTTRWIDSFFVPPDRRGVTGTPVGGPRDLDIPPVCLRRVALASGTDWVAAVERWRELVRELRGKPALTPESFATIEVGIDARPRAVLLRLSAAPDPPPQGFERLPERVGVALARKGVARVDAASVGELRRVLPDGVKPGEAYVRFDPDHPEGDVVLVVPGM